MTVKYRSAKTEGKISQNKHASVLYEDMIISYGGSNEIYNNGQIQVINTTSHEKFYLNCTGEKPLKI